MVPDEMTAEQLKTNAEYCRKLNQQLIQKDNIIKLLQLKLKNLESDLVREGAGGQDSQEDDGDRKNRLARKPPSKEERDAELEKIRGLTDRVSELERANDQLGADLEKIQEEGAEKDRVIAELKTRKAVIEPSPPNRELDRLRLQLSERDRELERAKEELSKLHAEPRWEPGTDPILKEELATAERALASSKEEVTKLQAQITDLTTRLESLSQAPTSPDGVLSRLPIAKAAIELLREANSLITHLPKDSQPIVEGFSTQLGALARAAGIERIRTVGTRFDPKLHQAVEMVYSSEYPHSTILSETSPGYSAGDVVARLADVIVSLNPYYCPTCDKVAPEGSRFCHVCGSRILGKEKEGVRILDERASCFSQVELGAAQELSGHLDLARAHYTKALALDPVQPKALAGMAHVAELEGSYEEALGLLERILTQSSEPMAIKAKNRIKTKLAIVSKLKDLT